MIRIFILTIFFLMNLGSWAFSQTTVSLNTGYNHATSSVYATGTRDNYWINLATSVPTTPPQDLAWNITIAGTSWIPAFPGTNWISAWNSAPSHLAPVTNIGYTIFRKCFCLMSFSQARLAFDIRGDDNLTVWFNTTLNTLLPATSGRWSWQPHIPFVTTDQSKFRIGVNCLYVLLEDTGGHMGFNLRGTISAYGLMPMPASGTATSFAPCGCDFTAPLKGTGPSSALSGTAAQLRARTAGGGEFDDRQIVAEIQKIAETRRAVKGRPDAK
jgi:hypothetical protein